MSDDRRYPPRPVLGVGAVIFSETGRVVLVQRGQPPLQGIWTLPGGVVEIGEPLDWAVVREVREETGLDVEVGPLIEIVEHVDIDHAGRAVYHFVVLDYVCRWLGGSLAAESDATAIVLADPEGLEAFETTGKTRAVIGRALRLSAHGPAARDASD